jgi:hypothetical protein
LFATEQAILQMHGLVVKNAAPSFASQPSNHAFFGLYQSSSTIVQKLFKNLSSECTRPERGVLPISRPCKVAFLFRPADQPHSRCKPPPREDLQQLAIWFERLRSSVLLNAVTEIGKGYEASRKVRCACGGVRPSSGFDSIEVARNTWRRSKPFERNLTTTMRDCETRW